MTWLGEGLTGFAVCAYRIGYEMCVDKYGYL